MKQFFKPENFGENGSIRRNLQSEGSRTELVQTFPLQFSGERREVANLLRRGEPVPDRYVNLLKVCKDPALADVVEHLSSVREQTKKAEDGFGREKKSAARAKQLGLLFNKNPIFATEHPTFAADAAKKISLIVDRLKEKHGEDFTAVSVTGSLSKGGWQNTPGNPKDSSDVDFIVIGKKFGLVDEFRDELKKVGLKPCGHYSFFSNQEQLPWSYVFFTGWLFGRDSDRERIYRMQYESIKKMSDYSWSVIANSIHDSQTYVDKIGERLNLSEDETSTLKAIRCLQSVPPYNRQEVLEIMKKNKRYSKYFEKD